MFNFVRATFADGEDFVSDAPESIAIEIDRAISALPRMTAELEGGTLPRGGDGGWLVYLRGGPDAAAGLRIPFVHAVVLLPEDDGEMPDSTSSVEQRLRDRYGPSPQSRVRELVAQLAGLPVAHGARILTELFLEVEKDEEPAVEERAALQGRQGRRARREREDRPIRVRRSPESHKPASPHLGWLVATFAAAAAGFFGALSFERGTLPALGTEASTIPAVSAAPEEPPTAAIARVGEAAALAQAEPAPPARDSRRDSSRQPRAEPSGNDAGATTQPRAGRVASAPAATPPVAAAPVLPAAEVSASVLWVRAGPGPEHKRTERLREGTRVVPSGPNQEGWTPIASPVTGWVASRFLAPVETAAAP